MEYLPTFVDVRGQRCLVVGGGEVALRKVTLLREAGARVVVVSPELCSGLASLMSPNTALGARSGPELEHVARAYASGDLDAAFLVIAATDRSEVNAQVAQDARARGLLVNVVDTPALCSFVMPAIVDRAPVLVAVSTSGASPVLARLTRTLLEAALPARLGELAAFAARHRARVQRALVEPAARRTFWEQTLDGELGQLVLAGRADEADRGLDAALARGLVPRAPVALIACGHGDPEQLSLAALRWLGRAELVLHAPAVAVGVLALARRDAARSALTLSAAGNAQLDDASMAVVKTCCARGGVVCIVREGHGDAASSDDVRMLVRAGLAYARAGAARD